MKTLDDIKSIISRIENTNTDNMEAKDIRKLTKEVKKYRELRTAIENGLTKEKAEKMLLDLSWKIKEIERRVKEHEPRNQYDETAKKKQAEIKRIYSYSDKKNQEKFLKFALS